MLNRLSRAVVASGALAASILSLFVMPDPAHAIPAFARKHNINCNTCHTAPPILNHFGQRYLENGYQLPGTEGGGITGKRKLGDLTLDDVTNYLAFGVTGDAVRHFTYERENPPGATSGVVQNKTEFTFPGNFAMYAGGTATKNVSFMVELAHNTAGGGVVVDRGFVTYNNIGYHDLAHVRVGKFDPSAFYSYATGRQQLASAPQSQRGSCTSFGSTCVFNRVGITPSAFATKFYGLYDRSGNYLSPFGASLYNSGSEVGVDIHGRPFGDWFLYQAGVINGANETTSDSNKGKDIYGMVRFDYARSNNFSASVSGFVYIGNSNAKVQSQEDVNWNRYGVAARATYKMIDLYAAFAIDKISRTPVSVAGVFDSTATGLTIGADAYVTDRTVLSVRYDNLDAGGVLSQRQSTSFVGVQAKYYIRSNISVYAHNDFNIRDAEEGNTANRNLRNIFSSGIVMVF